MSNKPGAAEIAIRAAAFLATLDEAQQGEEVRLDTLLRLYSYLNVGLADYGLWLLRQLAEPAQHQTEEPRP